MLDEEEARLWKAYKDRGSTTARESLARKYMPFAEKLAKSVLVRAPTWADEDVIYSGAYSGLCDALGKFEPHRRNSFKTYATPRIFGAIKDAIREQDAKSRTTRDRQKQVKQAEEKLQQQYHRLPTEPELLAECSLSPVDLAAVRQQTLSLERCVSVLTENRSVAFRERLVASAEEPEMDREDCLRHVMKGLDLREQTIVYLYYVCSATMKQIGEVLGVSESWVSQLHSRIIIRLRGSRSASEALLR